MKSPSAITLRAASVDDVDTLFDIRCAVRENHQSRAELARIGVTPASVAALIGGGDYYSPVAEIDRTPIGFAMAQLSRAYVFALFVRPGFEGRGAGGRLLAAVERRLAATGAARAWLTTENDRSFRAVAFYRRQGWREDGLDTHGELRFVKDLAPA